MSLSSIVSNGTEETAKVILAIQAAQAVAMWHVCLVLL